MLLIEHRVLAQRGSEHRRVLGQPEDLAWEGVEYGRTVAAEGIGRAEPLFPRIELETAVA